MIIILFIKYKKTRNLMHCFYNVSNTSDHRSCHLNTPGLSSNSLFEGGDQVGIMTGIRPQYTATVYTNYNCWESKTCMRLWGWSKSSLWCKTWTCFGKDKFRTSGWRACPEDILTWKVAVLPSRSSSSSSMCNPPITCNLATHVIVCVSPGLSNTVTPREKKTGRWWPRGVSNTTFHIKLLVRWRTGIYSHSEGKWSRRHRPISNDSIRIIIWYWDWRCARILFQKFLYSERRIVESTRLWHAKAPAKQIMRTINHQHRRGNQIIGFDIHCHQWPECEA